MCRVPEISVVVFRDEEDGTAPHGAWYGIAKEAFLHHQHARGAGAADELMAGEKYCVLGHESLNSSGTREVRGIPKIACENEKGAWCRGVRDVLVG